MSDPAVPRDLRDLPTLPPSPSPGSPAEAPTLPPERGPTKTPEDINVRYFGNYALSEEISRGGMGVVYKARQINLNRTVALKMILAGQLASKADVQRFQKEAEAAANLDHPNIVPIYEVGEHEGHHYFSMKLIEGGSLAQQLAHFRQDPRAAAKLLATVARAVHHAHERGILHRDIKPGNILVDQRGQPHVTDFGVAKRVEANTALTQIGVVVGTPSYMSPEQARSEKGLTTAVDIYSLGAVLYELLTGRPPFRSTSHFDTLLQVLEQQPERPRLLNPRADRDLEAICLKSLEKEPQKRYRSAEALAEDLERWLAHEPIQARPLNRGARLWRWCLRNPAVAGLLAGAALALVAGTAFSTYFAIQANQRAREATQEKYRADQNAQTALQERDRADENAKTALRERDRAHEKAAEALANARRAEESAADARANLYAAHMSVAQNAWEKGQLAQVPYLLNLYRNAKPGEPELRGWEWYYQDHLCRSDLLTLRVPRAAVHAVAFSPDGARLVSAGIDGKIHFWRLGTGQEVRVFPGHTTEVYGLAFSPDGAQLASAGGDQIVRLWDCTSGRQMHTFKGHQGPVRCVAFSPDGKHLASASADQTIRIWDVATERALHTLQGHSGRILGVAYAPDGAQLASAGADGIVKLWRSADGVELCSLTGHSGEIASVVFSPDGTRLASAGSDATVRLWDSVSGKLLRSLMGHKSTVWSLAYSSDGSRIASGSQDMTVKMWDAATGQELHTFRGHIREVYSVAFSPDGTRLASGSLDMTARVWDAVGGPEPRSIQGVWCMAFRSEER